MSTPQTKGERSSLSPPWAAGPAKSRSPHSTTATTFPPGLAGPRSTDPTAPARQRAAARTPRRGEPGAERLGPPRTGSGAARPESPGWTSRPGRRTPPRPRRAPPPAPQRRGRPARASPWKRRPRRRGASIGVPRSPPPTSAEQPPAPLRPASPLSPPAPAAGPRPCQRRAGALRAQPPRGSAPRPRSAGPGPPGPLSRVAAGAGVTADNGPRYCRQPRAGPDGRSSFGAKPGGGRVCRALPAAPRRPVTAAEKRDSALTSPRLFSPLASACRPPHDAPPRTAALEPKAAARPSREAVTPGVRSLSVPSGADVAPARQPPRCCPRAGCPR